MVDYPFHGLSDEKLKEMAKNVLEAKEKGERVECFVPYARNISAKIYLELGNPQISLRECLDIVREEFLLELCRRMIEK